MKTIYAILTAALLALPLQAQQSYAGIQLYPSDSVFHMRVDSLPVSTNLAAQIPSGDLTYHLQPIFGNLNGGFKIDHVPSTQPMVGVTGNTLYWTTAPIPSGAQVEGGAPNCTGTKPSGDSHLIILQDPAVPGGPGTSYEAYGACPNADGVTWNVEGEWGPATVGNLGGYAMTPQDNTSDNATGIPFLPTLITSADLAAGSIQHMIAISVPNPPRMYFDYLWPAADSSGAVSCTGGYADANHMLLDAFPPTSCPTTAGPAAGTVFRRKASASPLACVTAGTCPQTAMVELAAQQYGLIVVDNGGPFFGVLGEQSLNWSDTDLANMKQDMVTNYEPVNVSGQAKTLTAPIGNSAILAPVTTYQVNTPSTTTGTPVVVTAVYNGVTQTANVTVNPAAPVAALASVSVSPATVVAGQAATVTITLTAAAPSGGAVVTLSSNSTHFPVPTSYTVPAGSTTASFSVTAQ